MTCYVALLYSVVIDKTRRVRMADLVSIAEAQGYRNVRTVASTGNLAFEAEPQSVSSIETALETAFAAFHGKAVDIIVRSADDWRAFVSANPFPEESAANGDHVAVRVMRAPVADGVLDRFNARKSPAEQVAIVNGDLWIAFAGKPSASKLLGLLAPQRMGGIGTMRNWNTVRRLGELVSAERRCERTEE